MPLKKVLSIYLGGPWGDRVTNVGTENEVFAFLVQNVSSEPIESNSSFSRVVSTKTGVGTPQTTFNFAVGQKVSFEWDELNSLKINGIKFTFSNDGGSAWLYSHGSTPSISTATVFKDSSAASKPAGISLSIINNDNFVSPIFVTYTFDK